MAHTPPDPTDSPPLTQLGQRLVQDCAAVAGLIRQALAALAFWTAVVLPFLSLLLFVGGLDGQELLALGGLLAMNVIALVAGHDYARGPAS